MDFFHDSTLFLSFSGILIIGDNMIESSILKECKNYNTIMNYPYNHDDFITDNIINTYQEQIFSKQPNICKIKLLDQIVLKYLNDYQFKQYIQNYYSDETLAYFFQDDLKIVELYDKYQLNQTRGTKNTKWI